MKNILTTLAIAAISSVVFAQAGMLDSTFGVNGKMTFSGMNPNSVALQADGKIVIGGSDSVSFHFVVARLKVNGTLDSSFGIDGITKIGFDSIASAQSVILQPDGKIILIGSVTSFSGVYNADIALVRLNSNGSLDSSFGIDGKVITDIDNDDFGEAAV